MVLAVRPHGDPPSALPSQVVFVQLGSTPLATTDVAAMYSSSLMSGSVTGAAAAASGGAAANYSAGTCTAATSQHYRQSRLATLIAPTANVMHRLHFARRSCGRGSSRGGVTGFLSNAAGTLVVLRQRAAFVFRVDDLSAPVCVIPVEPAPHGDGCAGATASLTDDGALLVAPARELVTALQLHQARRPARVPLAVTAEPAAVTGARAPGAGGGLFDALVAGFTPAPHAVAGLGRRAVLATYALRESALQRLARSLAPYAAAVAATAPQPPLLLLTDAPPAADRDGAGAAGSSPLAAAAPSASPPADTTAPADGHGYVLLVPLAAATAAYGRYLRAQRLQQAAGAAGAGGGAAKQLQCPFLPPGVCWRASDQPLACVHLSPLPAAACAGDGVGGSSAGGAGDAAGGYAVAVADMHGQCADVFTVAPLPTAALQEPARVTGRPPHAGARGDGGDGGDDDDGGEGAAAAAGSPDTPTVRHVARAERGLTLARVTSLAFTRAHDALALQSDHGTAHLFPLPQPLLAVPSSPLQEETAPRRRPLAVVRAFAKLRPRVPRTFAPSLALASATTAGAVAVEGAAHAPSVTPHRGVIGAVADAVVTAASTHAAAAAAPAPPRFELAVVAGSAADGTTAATADDTLVVLDARGLLYAYQLRRQQQRVAAATGREVVAPAVPLDGAGGAAAAANVDAAHPLPPQAAAADTLTVFAPREVPPSPTAGVLAVDDACAAVPQHQHPQRTGSPPRWYLPVSATADMSAPTPLADYYQPHTLQLPLVPAPLLSAGDGGFPLRHLGPQQLPPSAAAAVAVAASPTTTSPEDGGADVLDRVAGWLTGGASWARRTLTGAGVAAGGAVVHAAGAVRSMITTAAVSAAAAAAATTAAAASDTLPPPAVDEPPYAATLLCAIDLRRSSDWPDVMHAEALLLLQPQPPPPILAHPAADALLSAPQQLAPPLVGHTTAAHHRPAADAAAAAAAVGAHAPAPGSPPPTAPPLTEVDTHAAVMALSALHPGAVHRAAAQLAASGLSAVSGRGVARRPGSGDASAAAVDNATNDASDSDGERGLEAALSRAQAEALVRELHGGGGGSGRSDERDERDEGGSGAAAAVLSGAPAGRPPAAHGHMFVTASPYAAPPPRSEGSGVGERAEE